LVVFFRAQDIDDRCQRDFAARFGVPERFAFGTPIDPAVPEVIAINSEGLSNSDIWHSDATFMSEPPMGSVLRGVQLPDSGGDTLFANMYAAYDALSSHLQRLVDGMTATHDFAKSATHRRRPLDDRFPPVEHPVVRTHPETGRRALYVNRIFTTRLNGVTARENDTLLPLLFDHVQSPDFQCRFGWRPGSVAFWDNRCSQHYAVHDFIGPRVVHRVVITGDRPY
jgi:taurine dioxygenase